MEKNYSTDEAKSPIILLNAPIEKLPNTKVRVINNFKQLGIKNLTELLDLIKKNDPKLSIFGNKSRQEIRALLADIIELPSNW